MINKILLTLVFATALQSHAVEIDVRIATEGAYHPWNFCLTDTGEVNNACTQSDVDSGDTLTGFDVEYGNALCDKMNELDTLNSYNCTWVVKPWSDLSVGLTLGTDYDLIIAQMTEKEDRRIFADFLGPYMFRPAVKYIALNATAVTLGGATRITPRVDDSGNTILDCPTDTSLTIGVQENTTHSEHVETYCLNPLITYATQPEADTALINGDSDLMINLTSSAQLSLLGGTSPIATAHGDSLVYPGSGAPSVAFDKDNSFSGALKPIVQSSMFSLYSSGVVRQLQDSWE